MVTSRIYRINTSFFDHIFYLTSPWCGVQAKCFWVLFYYLNFLFNHCSSSLIVSMSQTLGSGVWKWEPNRLQFVASVVTSLSPLFHLLKTTLRERSKKSQSVESKEYGSASNPSPQPGQSQASPCFAFANVYIGSNCQYPLPMGSYLIGQIMSPYLQKWLPGDCTGKDRILW